MLDRIELVFRSIKSATTAGDVLVATLVGLEELIEGARARIRIDSFNLTLKTRGSQLGSRWLISSDERSDIFEDARESRQAVLSTSGIDDERLLGQESPMPTADLLEFFHKLDSLFEEVTLELLRSKLLLTPRVMLLVDLLDE